MRRKAIGSIFLFAVFGLFLWAVSAADDIFEAARKGDAVASMSHDGKYLFFTSNRNGNDDVYWIEVKAVEVLAPGAATTPEARGSDGK